MAQVANAALPDTSKGKTKAKKRYLKAKKERRKNRTKVVVKGEPSGEPSTQKKRDESSSSESESSESDGDASGNGSEAVEPTPAKRAQKDGSRPKKRRKLDTPEAEDVPRATTPKETSIPPVTLRARSPTPPATLPVFPQPRRPDAPSKSVLALQGLDKALIEAQVVDPATTLPLEKDYESRDERTGLSGKMRKRLQELGIAELFAVQTAVVPLLLSSTRAQSLYRPYDPPEDLCVSAPTGSGKTLAYVLPIVEVLSARIVTRLRALIVLPTRDLVVQVRETFEAVAKGRGLKIGTATGQHSFAHEQSQLVAERGSDLQGGSSKVDVLICTPGRLMDHITGTPNFSLQHLRFLVIDEADRLLAQSFQDWLAQVLAVTRPPRPSDDTRSEASTPPSHTTPRPHPDALAPAFLHLLRGAPYTRTDIDERKEPSCQKLLFSATLTRDPAKIAALGLRAPRYIVVQGRKSAAATKEEGVLDFVMEKFTMPATLTEHMLVCESAAKPLMLFHMVHARGVTNALVFTKSAESATRLVRLFEFFEGALRAADASKKPVVARAYSSDLAPGERKAILEQFRNQEINILICSDLVSRGIDISHVSHVVSYDVPVDFRKYVHRVGRTARAGREGDAWTLVEEQEARYFKGMLKEADHLEKVKRLRVSDSDVASLKPAYETALTQLKEVYARSS
ncbi:DEAD-domain-containing protein [Trametes versicolor FP-101664 SS1]|uniref:DEAD-domain-containing protein n=1 Tax=Trametes versicolor (strain FP-101664) TaxID=717944 RepID=UPI0004621E67|nr:DEAD-domain-containing protein [Trametes versicolor FP-101664 SS1]EIW57320.1 DEAD-domain-containing protein [Trametes versicolor FP-101664 SS1]